MLSTYFKVKFSESTNKKCWSKKVNDLKSYLTYDSTPELSLRGTDYYVVLKPDCKIKSYQIDS